MQALGLWFHDVGFAEESLGLGVESVGFRSWALMRRVQDSVYLGWGF